MLFYGLVSHRQHATRAWRRKIGRLARHCTRRPHRPGAFQHSRGAIRAVPPLAYKKPSVLAPVRPECGLLKIVAGRCARMAIMARLAAVVPRQAVPGDSARAITPNATSNGGEPKEAFPPPLVLHPLLHRARIVAAAPPPLLLLPRELDF